MISGLALSLALAACGGDNDDAGSGIDGSKTVVSLSADERVQYCEWAITAQGGEGTVHRCDTFTLTVQSVEMCVASFDGILTSCTVTVAESELCVAAIVADPCGPAEACAALNACFPQ